MISVSWDEINRLSLKIASIIRNNNIQYNCIIGISRSGLVPAVIIAHALGEKNLTSISIQRNKTDNINSEKMFPNMEEDIGLLMAQKYNHWIIIDDIVGSGETIKYIRKTFTVPNRTIFVASLFFNSSNGDVNKINNFVDYFGQEKQSWVRFPWERPIKSI
ncbi:MAG: phosphoribosyltransferase family protein [Candidatus Dasytiphilus stammeri]